MKKVKRKSALGAIFIGILSIALGVTLGIYLCMNVIRYYTVKDNIFDHKEKELEAGQWYACDINSICGFYGIYEDGFYGITQIDADYGNKVFMAFHIPEKDYYELGADIVSDTFFLGEGEAGKSEKHITGVGQIREMSIGEHADYSKYIGDNGWDKVLYRNKCNYIIEMITPANLWDFKAVSGILLLISFVALGIYIIARFSKDGYMKQFEAVMSSNNIRMEHIEDDVNFAVHIGKLYIGEKYIVKEGLIPKLIILDQLVWVYPYIKEIQKSVNYIPTGKEWVYKVIFVNKNNETWKYKTQSQEQSLLIIQTIVKAVPYVIAGYNDELKELKKVNFEAMCKAVSDKKNKFDEGLIYE